jgi:hypothetical protein
MLAITVWIEDALAHAHGVMVQHFINVHDNPATGMRECAPAIQAAAAISALTKAKVCAERDGLPDVIGLATEELISLAATPAFSACPTEDIYERHYLAAWASILHAARTQAG